VQAKVRATAVALLQMKTNETVHDCKGDRPTSGCLFFYVYEYKVNKALPRNCVIEIVKVSYFN
jgi:hypothetical protein